MHPYVHMHAVTVTNGSGYNRRTYQTECSHGKLEWGKLAADMKWLLRHLLQCTYQGPLHRPHQWIEAEQMVVGGSHLTHRLLTDVPTQWGISAQIKKRYGVTNLHQNACVSCTSCASLMYHQLLFLFTQIIGLNTTLYLFRLYIPLMS